MPIVILGLIPAIPHIVLGIEALFGHGKGGTKKQAAVDMVQTILNTTVGADPAVMAYVSDLIEANVKYLTANGTMPHAA
jgi:hypothetical protein